MQELQNDPLGILRPASKLQHNLHLASAYAAVYDARDGSAAQQKQKRRMDPKYHEPKVQCNKPCTRLYRSSEVINLRSPVRLSCMSLHQLSLGLDQACYSTSADLCNMMCCAIHSSVQSNACCHFMVCSLLIFNYAALQFTNMGQGFQGTLDYVLYTTNSLVPTATLELPDEADIKSSRSTRAGLPNETWSSDHIALLAEFQYKQN